MNEATINDTSFTLTGPNDAPVAGDVTYVAATRIATFSPTSELELGTTYTAAVSTGAQDEVGEALLSELAWSFTTQSLPGPLATNPTPAHEATGVAVTATPTVTFSANMDEVTIDETAFTLTGPDEAPVAGEVSYVPLTRIATFVPTNNLQANTTYNATVTTGAQDEDGVALAEPFVWSFTTAEGLTVTATDPSTGGEICSNRSISANFSRPLEPVSIGSPATSFTLADTLNNVAVDGHVDLDVTGTIATFTPDADLALDTGYTATISTDVEDQDGIALEDEVVWTFTTRDTFCQQAINLGATELYGVLSNTGVTLGGGPNSTTGLRVDGDVGIFPAGACVGCDSTTVSGVIDNGNTVAQAAITAMEAAYNEAIGLATNLCTLIDSGVLTTNPSAACGGNADGVFAPGLYWSATSIAIPAGGTITLDAGNDSDAVFIFQSESTVDTIGGNTHIILSNGAQAKNVFWVAKSSATIGGTNSDFAGTVLALIGITVNTGTDMEGRALARGAAVTVQDGALITVPAE